MQKILATEEHWKKSVKKVSRSLVAEKGKAKEERNKVCLR